MNNKNFKTLMIVAVVALIAVVGVGYAALSSNLTINGSGNVKASSWKIKFANLSDATLTGKAQEITKPTISNNDTHIGNYAVTFNIPDDKISYTFDVVNEGTLDAEISSITMGAPECTGTGETEAEDSANVCDWLSYRLTYADGTPVAEGDTLNAGATKNLKLELYWKSSNMVEQLPVNDVAISNLEVTIVYAQK